MKVHKTEVDLMDVKSIQFHDGSGYLYGMDVFHQLHCLNYLRKKTILYHDMYPPTAEDEQVPPEHHIRLSRRAPPAPKSELANVTNSTLH